MQVILLSDVDNLGLRGELVDVAPGYARNFLLPRRLAQTATEGRIAQVRRLEEQKVRARGPVVYHWPENRDLESAAVLVVATPRDRDQHPWDIAPER